MSHVGASVPDLCGVCRSSADWERLLVDFKKCKLPNRFMFFAGKATRAHVGPHVRCFAEPAQFEALALPQGFGRERRERVDERREGEGEGRGQRRRYGRGGRRRCRPDVPKGGDFWSASPGFNDGCARRRNHRTHGCARRSFRGALPFGARFPDGCARARLS